MNIHTRLFNIDLANELIVSFKSLAYFVSFNLKLCAFIIFLHILIILFDKLELAKLNHN